MRVRALSSFQKDVRSQIAWLRRHRDRTWIARLRTGLREVRQLLAAFPEAGPPRMAETGVVLRKIVLRELPFVVWYVDDGAAVWLVRLFHTRQDRPRTR